VRMLHKNINLAACCVLLQTSDGDGTYLFNFSLFFENVLSFNINTDFLLDKLDVYNCMPTVPFFTTSLSTSPVFC